MKLSLKVGVMIKNDQMKVKRKEKIPFFCSKREIHTVDVTQSII